VTHGDGRQCRIRLARRQPVVKAVVVLPAQHFALLGNEQRIFDPASPITTYTEDSNGTEDVKTESVAASWTSIWTNRLSSNLRAQFSRDLQQSFDNSDTAKIFPTIAFSILRGNSWPIPPRSERRLSG